MKGIKELKIVAGELIGSVVFLTMLYGSVAQFVFGVMSFYTICVAHVIGLACGIYISRHLSGGHLNPAVTIALCVYRNPRDFKYVPLYFIGQFLGAFLAAAIVFGLYQGHIAEVDPGFSVPGAENAVNPTAGIFGTYPAAAASTGSCVLAELIGTMFLMMSIMSVTDADSQIDATFGPFVIGLALGGVGLGMGSIAGFSVNPARDFGARLFTSIMYGSNVWSVSNYYFWVPLTMPFVGALAGGGLYKLAHYSTK